MQNTVPSYENTGFVRCSSRAWLIRFSPMVYHGDDNDQAQQKQKAQSGPVEPGELQIPQGLGTILGSEHEAEENKKLL